MWKLDAFAELVEAHGHVSADGGTLQHPHFDGAVRYISSRSSLSMEGAHPGGGPGKYMSTSYG